MFWDLKDLKAQLKQKAADSEAELSQLRADFESERKKMEDSHQTKLAGAFRRHEELEDQIQEMQCKHLMWVSDHRDFVISWTKFILDLTRLTL